MLTKHMYDMSTYFVYVILCFTIILNQNLVKAERRCRCLANNPSCWPNQTVWNTFNDSVDGRMILPRPSASVCTIAEFNLEACIDAATSWFNSMWRSYQVGAMQYYNWENASCAISNPNVSCQQGSMPVIGVNATLPEHVQTTVKYVAKNNLRLVIKSTGHDMFGRSTAVGSLLLWLHYMKNMTLIEQYERCDGTMVLNAVRLGAGVQWNEVYEWLAKNDLTIVGGTCNSVSAIGGFLQGGGHSLLSRWKGLAVDQVLEYDVITADGQRLTVNPCQNSDLFWALSGGGGGTFGVVLSAVLQTFPMPYVIGSLYSIVAPNEDRYATLIRDFIRLLPHLADAGWAGYVSMVDTSISIIYLWPNGNFDMANAVFSEFMKNNSDIYFLRNITAYVPTFYEAYKIAFNSSDPTGFNLLISSRLIPERIVRNRPDDVAKALLKIKGHSTNGSSLTVNLVAGGQVSNISNVNNSVNPAWRTALLHVFFGQAWGEGLSIDERNWIAEYVVSRAQVLDALSDGDPFGSYMNEASPNEPNWQQKFFGSQGLYDRLKVIKTQVDPDDLFVCHNCVGSEEWTADLNCPKTSIASKISASFQLTLTFTFILIRSFILFY